MSVHIIPHQGVEMLPYILDLAELRMTVFREYPYLYDGSLSYEKKYLHQYIDCRESMIILAIHDDQVVGASTALPLSAETDTLKAPFIEQHYPIEKIMYLGESVILPAYRHRGIEESFFKAHFAALQRKDYTLLTFCEVERPLSHPKRPPDYHELNTLWESLGFVKHPELSAPLSWKEVDETIETPKPMVFWLKRLSGETRLD